jgi:hypothetical protein
MAERVETLPKKHRDFIDDYFITGSAISSYAKIFNKDPKKISNQPYAILRGKLGAEYLKELKLRAFDKSILTRDELTEIISTQAIEGCLKSQDMLAKILGAYEKNNEQGPTHAGPVTVTIALDKGPE